MIAGRLDDLLHALGAADIARIDAQAGRPALRRLDGAAIVEMNVRNDRDIDLGNDVLERQRAFLIRAGNPDDIDACQLGTADLRDRPLDIGGQGVGHRLHRDRRVAAHRHPADMNLPRDAPGYLLIGAIAHDVGLSTDGRIADFSSHWDQGCRSPARRLLRDLACCWRIAGRGGGRTRRPKRACSAAASLPSFI